MWIGSPSSSSSSNALTEAFCMIRFDSPMYSGDSYFLSFWIFNSSFTVLVSPVMNSIPLIEIFPRSA